MRVRLQAADSRACSFYRLEEPARVAECDAYVTREPFDIYEAPFGKVVCGREEYEGEDRVVEWHDDVAVFQRPVSPTILEAIPLLQRRGIAVVIDLDDDLGRLVPNHPSNEYFMARNSVTQQMCLQADLVTCTTEALAERYAPHGRYAILPNCVPHRLLEMERCSDGRTVGWSGFQEMHPGDLEEARGGVRDALDIAEWKFRTIGPPEGVGKALHLKHFEATGVIEMEDYYLCLGTLDIGIVPLALNQFNHAKSYLKGLEFAARGVPFVASKTDPYVELSEMGLGFSVPNRGRNWRAQLLALMESPGELLECAEEEKAQVAEHHTYETQGWQWTEAWERAMDNRAAASEREAMVAT